MVILPVRGKRFNIRPITVACQECSLTSERYCNIHMTPHMFYEDETTACVDCVEELVHKNGVSYARMFADKVRWSQNQKHVREVVSECLERVGNKWGNTVLSGHGFGTVVGMFTGGESIARPLVCFSMRKDMSINDVIDVAISEPEKVFLGVE